MDQNRQTSVEYTSSSVYGSLFSPLWNFLHPVGMLLIMRNHLIKVEDCRSYFQVLKLKASLLDGTVEYLIGKCPLESVGM